MHLCVKGPMHMILRSKAQRCSAGKSKSECIAAYEDVVQVVMGLRPRKYLQLGPFFFLCLPFLVS